MELRSWISSITLLLAFFLCNCLADIESEVVSNDDAKLQNKPLHLVGNKVLVRTYLKAKRLSFMIN